MLNFEFTANNNHVEYEALIAGMILALEMGVTRLKTKNESQWATNQVSGQFQAKEPQLIKYLYKVQK